MEEYSRLETIANKRLGKVNQEIGPCIAGLFGNTENLLDKAIENARKYTTTQGTELVFVGYDPIYGWVEIFDTKARDLTVALVFMDGERPFIRYKEYGVSSFIYLEEFKA